MENLPITTPVPPPTGKANTTSATADAASPDAQNGGDFDAALQRELAREPAADPSQAADKVAVDEAAQEMSLVDPSLPATSSDTIMALLLTAPAVAVPRPIQAAQPTQEAQEVQGIQGVNGTQGMQGMQGTQGTQGIQGIQGIQGVQGTQGIQGTQGTQGIYGVKEVQTVQTDLITAPGIGLPKASGASAQPPQSREHAGLPEAATDKPLPAAGHEASFAVGGKTLTALAAASDPALRPAATEIRQLFGADSAPVIQANALTAMTSHAIAHPAASGAAAGQELKIAPQVGTTGWDGALAQKVVWLASERQQVAELHLNPPHLGPLEVRVSVAADQSGTAHAQFTSPHAAVREAIEAAMPRLREILAESGITLGNTTVGNESFRQQQGFTPADGSLAAWREKADAGASSQAGAIAGVTRSVRNGMVDIFA